MLIRNKLEQLLCVNFIQMFLLNLYFQQVLIFFLGSKYSSGGLSTSLKLQLQFSLFLFASTLLFKQLFEKNLVLI